MNAQDIFNTVTVHLFTQGRPAMKDGQCSYRGDMGTSCAVGCLIPDDEYDPAMDDLIEIRSIARRRGMDDFFGGTSIDGLLKAGLAPEWMRDQHLVLAELQMAHDGCLTDENGEFDPEHLFERLCEVANGHGFDTTVLEIYRPANMRFSA